MRKDFSPEEKLLRLIKGVKKKVQPKEEELTPKIQSSANGMPQLSKISAYQKVTGSKMAKSISISLPFKLKEINTETLNTILVIILGCLLLYFVYDLGHTLLSKKTEPGVLAGDEHKTPKVTEGKAALEVKPYSFYSSSVGGRNIFMPQELEVESITAGPVLEEVRANLSLIGVIAGDKPQAIIEDKKSGKSYFLYKGSTVGQAKVVDILEDTVIMEYNGQRFELVL
jgi:hypothetical protein